MRAFDRDPIRGEHYGQRPWSAASTGRTHGCTNQPRITSKKTLAKAEPSTHGTKRAWHAVRSGDVTAVHCASVDVLRPTSLRCALVAKVARRKDDRLEGSFPDGLHWRSSAELLQVEKEEAQVCPSAIDIHCSADFLDRA